MESAGSKNTHNVAVLHQPLFNLPDPLPLPTLDRPFDVSITPPGSKSLTNRALLLAALAQGTSILRRPLLDADDAKVMIAALRSLGTQFQPDPHDPSILRVTGVGGQWKIPPGQAVALDLHNAGTATRFLAAAALLAPPNTHIIIDGDARMRQRPIAELAAALKLLGASVEYLGSSGCPPLKISPPSPSFPRAHSIDFGKTSSSQFVSALLMIGSLLKPTLQIRFTSPITSESYVHMTLGLLKKLGFVVTGSTQTHIEIRLNEFWLTSGVWPGFELCIEPDASGATYFLAAAALCPGSHVKILGLGRSSLQGDARFAHVLAQFGAHVEVNADSIEVRGSASIFPADIDLSDMPDTAMTAAAVACFSTPTQANPTATTTLRGLSTLRVKETDRLEALRIELTKLGARIDIFSDHLGEGLCITPPADRRADTPILFDTYNDHRMAMGLSLIGLCRRGISINNPQCVAKTYPGYWADLAGLYVGGSNRQ